MSYSASKTRQDKDEVDVILSSSGVRAPCFIGGIKGIQEKGYRIQRIAGTSGGAIIAAGHALGMTSTQMEEMSQNIPYESFKDFKIRNLCSLHNPSVYTGQPLDEFYKKIFGDAKLKDFQIDCYITVVTIVGRNRIVLSKNTHPDLPVWQAVRMSSTIPFIFPYLTLDGEPVTDGALVTSMFDIFPDRKRTSVALRPRADYFLKRELQDVEAGRVFLWNYLKILAEYFLDAVDNQHVPQEEWDKTIVIPTKEIGGFSFNIGPEEIHRLIQYGYRATTEAEILPAVE